MEANYAIFLRAYLLFGIGCDYAGRMCDSLEIGRGTVTKLLDAPGIKNQVLVMLSKVSITFYSAQHDKTDVKVYSSSPM